MEDEQIENSDESFFTANLPEPSIKQADAAVSNYQDALDAFYITYKRNSSLLLYSEHFEPTNEKEFKPVMELLSTSNYELSALSGEHVVLFNEPMLVAEISLSELKASEAAKIVRLISYGHVEKKVTSKIISSYKQGLANNLIGQRPKEVTTFDVHDYVTGLILPKKCRFESLKAASLRNIIKDKEHVINLQDAYLKLKNSGTEATLAWQDTINRARDLIKEGSTRLESTQNDLHFLNQQKATLESRLSSLQENASSMTKLANEIQESIDSGNIKIQELEERSKELTKQYDQDKKAHVLITENLLADKNELTTIRQELSEARKQKSLSNYESIEHTNEAKAQLFGYYLLATAVLIALCSFVTYLYMNAESFKDLLSRLVLLNASSWDILLSRLPLMTATALVIGALSGVLFFLVKQIVSLNNEKMTMLKAGILAQQISDSLDIEHKSDKEIIQIKKRYKDKTYH